MIFFSFLAKRKQKRKRRGFITVTLPVGQTIRKNELWHKPLFVQLVAVPQFLGIFDKIENKISSGFKSYARLLGFLQTGFKCEAFFLLYQQAQFYFCAGFLNLYTTIAPTLSMGPTAFDFSTTKPNGSTSFFNADSQIL